MIGKIATSDEEVVAIPLLVAAIAVCGSGGMRRVDVGRRMVGGGEAGYDSPVGLRKGGRYEH
jgi:hypothetical protein